MKINFDELTLDNVGNWPWSVKIAAIVILFVALIIVGILYDTRSQIRNLTIAQKKEQSLRKNFEIKQGRAANFKTYFKQLVKMQELFLNMTEQLPTQREVPALLESISQSGLSSGLEFKLFKPLPEKSMDFYAELPLEMKVVGSYHQLANFISSIAHLGRIVTIHDLTIQYSTNSASTQSKQTEQKIQGQLTMEIVAKTYRYKAEEIAATTRKNNDAKS